MGELAKGRQCRLKLNSYSDKVIVHVALLAGYFPGGRNLLAIHFMQLFASALPTVVVTDHGHRHSAGDSHVTFVLKALVPSDGGMDVAVDHADPRPLVPEAEPLASTASTAPSATGPSESVLLRVPKLPRWSWCEDPTATAASMVGKSASSEVYQQLAATTSTAPSATGPSVSVQSVGAKTAAEELVEVPTATAASVEGHSVAMEVCQPLAATTATAPSATGPTVNLQASLARHAELARLSRLERLTRPEPAKTASDVLMEDPTATAASVGGNSASSAGCQLLAATTSTAPSAAGPSVSVQTEGAMTAADVLMEDPMATAAYVGGNSASSAGCQQLAATTATAPSATGPSVNLLASLARHAELARLSRLERFARSRSDGTTAGTYETAFPLLPTRPP